MLKIINFLLIMSIIALPFDSFPFLLNSTYRPLSIFFILLAFPLILMVNISRKAITIRKTNFVLYIFCLYSVLFSFVFAILKYNDFSGFFDFTITLLLGAISFYCFDFFLSKKKNIFIDNKRYLKYVFSLVASVYIIASLWGIFELFVLMDIFPYQIKENIYLIISGRSTERIQLFSGEPSWAAKQLLFALPIFYFLMKENKRYRKFFIWLSILFLLMFSLQGYLIFCIALIAYLALSFNIKKSIRYLIYIGLLFVVFFIVWFIMSNLISSDVYYITRIKKYFEIKSLKDILYADGSTFIRIGYPIVAFIMFFDNFILGVGGGNFRFEFADYIYKYFENATMYAEVSDAINKEIATPKNLYARLLAETGFIGFSIYMYYILKIYRKIKFIKGREKEIIKIWFILCMALYIQFDSFLFMNSIFMLAVINNLSLNKKYDEDANTILENEVVENGKTIICNNCDI